MKKQLIFVIFTILLTSCTLLIEDPLTSPTSGSDSQAVMPNPASEFCEDNAGSLEIRKDDTGGEVGYCLFADGSECEEWAYYRGECSPGDSLGHNANMPNPSSVYCIENGGTLEIRKDEAGNEVGFCLFPDGSECDTWAYFRGECSPGDSLADNANLPNPASVYCVDQGGTLEIRKDEAGNETGFCLFPDGSECDEWAFSRGECQQGSQSEGNTSPTPIPTPVTINADDYQGWWTYTHSEYGFSLMLSEDWAVEEISESDLLLSGHLLNLTTEGVNIRLTFRQQGEDVLLWTTGVGAGEFIDGGTLDIAGQPVNRTYFVCPNGEINAIWYQGNEGSPNILRNDLEFAFIFSLKDYYCEAGHSISGKLQHVGEMIITSLKVQ
jgi:putative hemolysin